jgi:hypothetical protein
MKPVEDAVFEDEGELDEGRRASRIQLKDGKNE